ncbi:MAG: TRAP transporter substrate-binding protein DctP [Rhodobacteraceae bacterium]|nr:TRAP transporter substrate-binding protein DctP [Paracoccaceae bacterium]
MTMKTRNKSLVTYVGAFALAMAMGVSATAGERTLRFTTQLPAKNFATLNAVEFTQCVAANTDINIEVYDSAQLYRDKEVPQAVSSGAIDMGMTTTARFAGTIPAIEILYVPFAMGTREETIGHLAPGAALRTILDDAMTSTGARPVYWMDYGTAVFLSKAGNPIRKPSDVEGMKVRVFGKTLGDFVTALGGAPTLTSGSEQFLAYQRGTVDAGMTGIGSVKSRKLYEVMDVVTRSEHAKIEFVMLINDGVWGSMSGDEQAAMSKCGLESEANLRASIAAIEADAAAVTIAKGKEVIELSDAERSDWKAAAKPVVDAYLANSGELGAKILAAIGK